MRSFLLLIVFLGLGVLLRRTRPPSKRTLAALNLIIIGVCVPCLTFLQIQSAPIRGEDFLAPISLWLLFAGALVLFGVLGRVFRWNRRTVGALVLTAGLANTSFVGFPLISALVGEAGLARAVLLDQLGSFLLVSSAGVAAAAYYRGAAGASYVSVLLGVIRFPPFIALLLATALRGAQLSPWVYELLRFGALPLAPLALLSIGLQLRMDLERVRAFRRELMWGLSYKLVLGPALISLPYLIAIGSRGLDFKTALLENSMAPMLTGAILVQNYELDAELASLMISMGVPLSLVSVPILAWLIA